MDTFEAIGGALAQVGLAGLGGGQLLLLAGAIVGLTVVMVSTARRIRRSRGSPTTSVQERYAAFQEQSRTSRDVEQVMLELDQLSRQIHGRLDTKLARLQILIADADQRIARLSSISRASQTGSQLEITLEEEVPPKTACGSEDTRHTQVYRLCDEGHTSVDIARRVGRTTGEVELILSLRNVRAGSPAGSQLPGSVSAVSGK